MKINRKKLAESLVVPLNQKNKSRIAFYTPSRNGFEVSNGQLLPNELIIHQEAKSNKKNNSNNDNDIIPIECKYNNKKYLSIEHYEQIDEKTLKIKENLLSLLEPVDIDKNKIISLNENIKFEDIVNKFNISCTPIFIDDKIKQFIDDINICISKRVLYENNFLIFNSNGIDIIINSYSNTKTYIEKNKLNIIYPISIIPIYDKTIFFFNKINNILYIFNPISEEMMIEFYKKEVIKEISEYTK